MRRPLLLLSLLLTACAGVTPRAADPPASGPAPLARKDAAGPEESPPGPLVLGVADAVRTAVEHNPDLRVASARIEEARQGVAEARAAFYPSLSAGIGYTHTNDPVLVFMEWLRQRELNFGMDFNHPDGRGNFRASLSARWLLYDGGRRRAAEDLARFGVDLSADARAVVLNGLKAAVIETCLVVFETEEFIRVAEDSVKLVREQLKIVTSRFEAGAARRSDVLSVEVRLAEAREALVKARNARERALNGLRGLLGLSASEPFRLAEGKGFHVPPVDEKDLLATARAHRPEIRRAARAVRAARREVELEATGTSPTVSAFGSYDLDDQSGTFTGRQDSATGGIRVDVPIFSGFSTRARVARARARLLAAEAEERKAILAVETDVKNARLALAEARERLTVSEKSTERAEEALSLIRARYESGAATITEYLDAEVALTGARVRKVAARYDVERATAELRRALGICRAGTGGKVTR